MGSDRIDVIVRPCDVTRKQLQAWSEALWGTPRRTRAKPSKRMPDAWQVQIVGDAQKGAST